MAAKRERRERRPKEMGRPLADDSPQVAPLIQEWLRRNMGVVMSADRSVDLWREIAEYIFAHVLEQGAFRFPMGLGSLHIRRHQPRHHVLPTGERVEVRLPYAAIKYREGLAARELLGKTQRYERKTKRRPMRKLSEFHLRPAN